MIDRLVFGRRCKFGAAAGAVAFALLGAPGADAQQQSQQQASPAPAQAARPPSTAELQQESPVHMLARKAGLAIVPPDPPDFVRDSRPAVLPPAVPVFSTPEEPPSKVMSKSELNAMDADLVTEDKKHDKLRAAYPPSAKAMAEAEAAKKAKQPKKPADPAAK